MFEPNNQNMYSPSAKVGLEPTFFGKVMSFFALAMLASVVGIYVTSTYFLPVFIANPALMWLLFAVELGLVFTSRKWSQKSPLNKILFGLFAFISGATIAPLIGLLANMPGGPALITKALLITVLMFAATAIVGWTSRINFAGLRGFLTMALIGMIIVSVIGFFVPWGSTFELVFSGIGILLFSGFIMHDFQALKRFPEDRPMDAALMLYLDIFNLFVFILRFLISLNRD